MQGLDELRRTALPNGLRVVTMRRAGALLAGVLEEVGRERLSGRGPSVVGRPGEA